MIICIATDTLFPRTGGIASFNHHMSVLLEKEGHTVIMLAPGEPTGQDAADEITRVGNIITVKLQATFQKHYQDWVQYFRPGGFDAPYWIALGYAMREWLLRQTQFSIEVVEVSDYGGLGVFLTDKNLPPVVLTGHGSFKQYARYNYTRDDDHARVITMLEDLSFAHAEKVISHSPLDQQDLRQLFKRDIDIALIPFTKPDTIIPGEGNKVITAGGLQPIKGIYQMAEALELLRDKLPDFRLNWIGNDTFLAPGQQKMSTYLAKKYPKVWQQNLVWENEIPALQTLEEIAAASFVVIPSYFETFNYTALEAASMNKPILITAGAGAVAHFKHGESAWIMPANRPKALAEGIMYLNGSPETRNTIADGAKAMVTEWFTPAKIVQPRIELYLEAIRERKAPAPDLLHVLDQWHTGSRKTWYGFRNKIKKILGR